MGNVREPGEHMQSECHGEQESVEESSFTSGWLGSRSFSPLPLLVSPIHLPFLKDWFLTITHTWSPVAVPTWHPSSEIIGSLCRELMVNYMEYLAPIPGFREKTSVPAWAKPDWL